MPPSRSRRDPVPGLVSVGFVVCTLVAVGHGLWALYGSGSRLSFLEIPGADRGASVSLGPVALDPGMNPLRAILRTGHAPVGSTRIRYRIEMVDVSGRPAWLKEGSIGSTDDEASIVWSTASLAMFEIPARGTYVLQVAFSDLGMDDLRRASIELRRNVAPVDARIPWTFGVAAAVLLVTHIVLSRRGPWPYRGAEGAPRAAA